jgi:hypothetical protein
METTVVGPDSTVVSPVAKPRANQHKGYARRHLQPDDQQITVVAISSALNGFERAKKSRHLVVGIA